jgi:hypothetical protein
LQLHHSRRSTVANPLSSVASHAFGTTLQLHRPVLQVKLPGSPKSRFWRFHTSGVTDEGVCTIEALHLLLCALAGVGL